MYETLIPVSQEVLEVFLALLGKEHENHLQCLVSWDGNWTTILILDEPPCSRIYINGEWVLQDVERTIYCVFTTTEDFKQSSGYNLADTVEGVLKAQVSHHFDSLLEQFQRCSKLMGAAFGAGFNLTNWLEQYDET